MAYYRIYLMDEAGHIRQFKEVEAGRDDDAVAFALGLEGRQRVEVWSGVRLVSRLGPEISESRR